MIPRLGRLVVILCAFAGSLHAHDLYTSWTDATLRGDRMLLSLTLSRVNALRLIPNSAAHDPITPENFSRYTAALRAAAPELFELTTGTQTLLLVSSSVALSGDDDVTFKLAFTWRGAISGKLRITARYLQHLVDGHVGTIAANDAAGKDLDWSPVSIERPTFELTLPKPRG